jgi:hypothetical protein
VSRPVCADCQEEGRDGCYLCGKLRPDELELVLVHADGGACHGRRIVDNRCVGCGIAPDMQSTGLWLPELVHGDYIEEHDVVEDVKP